MLNHGSKTCQLCGRVKPLSEYHKNKQIKDGKHTICKTCNKAKVKKWREDYPDRLKNSHYKHKYNLTLDEFNKMRAAVNFRCEICGLHEDSAPRGILYVDHCHKTNEVRGLLCQGCNNVLGAAFDNPDVLLGAVKYLNKSIMEKK